MSNGYSANHGMMEGHYNAEKLLMTELYSRYEGASAECPNCHTTWKVQAQGLYARLLKIELTFKKQGCPHCKNEKWILPSKVMAPEFIHWDHNGISEDINILSTPKGFRPIK